MDVLPLLQELEGTLLPERKAGVRMQLSQHLNHLLLHDFQALVQLLYRVDVPEKKIKTVVEQNPGTDAGDLLADLIIQRQEEKKAMRKKFQSPQPDDGEETW